MKPIRIVDSTTAERVLSIAGEGSVKKGGGFLKDASLSREAEWGLASEEGFGRECALGKTGGIFPEGTGALIKAGTKFQLNLHYAPNGKRTTE